MIETSAGAVIFFKENLEFTFLLLKYSSGHWDFPKGNVEENEKIEETAKREILEETGIDSIDFVPGFSESIQYYYTRNKTTISKKVYYFLAESKTKNVTLSDEHLSYKWLNYHESLSTLTYSNAKDLLKKAFLFIKTQLP